MKPKVNSLKEAQNLEVEHYDKTYATDEYWQSPALKLDIRHRILYAKRFLKPNSVVLDVGCGGGGVVNGIAENISSGLGIDISKEGISYANRNKKQNTNFQCIPIKDFINKSKTKFDAVLFFECLEHLYNGEEIIKELTKVMNPGALFIMSTPNYGRLIYRLQRSIIGKFLYALTKNDKFRFKITHSHIKEFSIEEVKSIMKNNNLRLINHTGRILWTDPVFKEKPSRLQILNMRLGKIFPSLAGYMYMAAVYGGKNE